MRAYRGLWVSVESNGWDKTATMKHIVCQEILSRWNDEGRRYGGLVDCGSLVGGMKNGCRLSHFQRILL